MDTCLDEREPKQQKQPANDVSSRAIKAKGVEGETREVMKQKNNASIKSTKTQKQASHKENKFHVLRDLDGASSASDLELHETYVGAINQIATGIANYTHRSASVEGNSPIVNPND